MNDEKQRASVQDSFPTCPRYESGAPLLCLLRRRRRRTNPKSGSVSQDSAVLTLAASCLFLVIWAAAAARCNAFCSARSLLLLLLLPTREACYDSRTYQPRDAALTNQLNPTVNERSIASSQNKVPKIKNMRQHDVL